MTFDSVWSYNNESANVDNYLTDFCTVVEIGFFPKIKMQKVVKAGDSVIEVLEVVHSSLVLYFGVMYEV